MKQYAAVAIFWQSRVDPLAYVHLLRQMFLALLLLQLAMQQLEAPIQQLNGTSSYMS